MIYKAMITAAITALILPIGFGQEAAEATPEASASQDTVPPEGFETLDKKVSYILGFSTAAQYKAQGLDLDVDKYIAGLMAGLADEASLFDDDEVRSVLTEYTALAQQRRENKQNEVQAENLATAEAYLAENGSKAGVVTTGSGLQYKVLETGNGGVSPTAGSSVRVHYEGKLIDDEVFDSSIARGEPAEFPVSGVIAGWTEALQLMHAGDVWEVYIHPAQAYGRSGSGGIGPNEALIFRIELLDVLD